MVNGFNRIATGCDVIIADGLRGNDERIIDVQGKYCPSPKIAAAIAEADIIISLNHFKGHEQAGFGGAVKNLGMGSGSVAGKREMHSTAQPVIDIANCTGCGVCEKHCAHDAVHVVDGKAAIDLEKCVGCGQCVAMCRRGGAVMGSTESCDILNFKIDEYAKAVLKGKPNFHISFIMNVSPECDCWGHNDAAIVPDLGIAASFDPVALDRACADLVNAAPTLRTGNELSDKEAACCSDGHHSGGDCCCHGGAACFKKHLTVFLDEHDIRVLIRYAQAHAVRACVQVKVNVEQLVALRLHDGHPARVHKLCYLGYILLLYIGQDLKLLVCVAYGDTGCNGGGDALQTARVRNDYAFHIFDNVAAYDDVDLLRHISEHGTGLCSGICHCDRLGAAHCGDKLLLENLQVLRVFFVSLYHIKLSFDTIISTPIISPIFPFA